MVFGTELTEKTEVVPSPAAATLGPVTEPTSAPRSSETVTVKEHWPVRPTASVAVQVTVVTPTGNAVPEPGTHWTDAPAQLSDAVGVV